MTTAFVTGGSGFLGRTLIATLAARGIRVRALARSPDAAETVRRAGAESVTGDLDDVKAMTAGMSGCDVVFHTAAIVAEWGDPQLFDRVNVGGTEHALAAARAAGVPRFVHVSTEAVLAGPAPLVGVDETAPKPAAPYGPYARTKSLAEDRVVAANASGFATVVVRPRFVWGAGDTSVLPKIVAAVRAGRFRWIDGGHYPCSTTHVRNACEALRLAAERGHGGAIYFATDGAPVEFRSFVTRLLASQGVTPSARRLPRRAAWVIATIVETLWGWLRLKAAPPTTRLAVKMMGEAVTLDDNKARRDLGYAPVVTVEAGLEELAASGPSAQTAAPRAGSATTASGNR